VGYKNKDIQSVYQIEWMNKRKQKWFSENGPCKVCGSWENLELDHINREEKVSHRVWSWKAERRLVELAKCQVLCYFCHKEKSKSEKSIKPICGTYHSYSHYGCRCVLCKAANAKRKSEQKLKRKIFLQNKIGLKS
jgi:hypothetical protein